MSARFKYDIYIVNRRKNGVEYWAIYAQASNQTCGTLFYNMNRTRHAVNTDRMEGVEELLYEKHLSTVTSLQFYRQNGFLATMAGIRLSENVNYILQALSLLESRHFVPAGTWDEWRQILSLATASADTVSLSKSSGSSSINARSNASRGSSSCGPSTAQSSSPKGAGRRDPPAPGAR